MSGASFDAQKYACARRELQALLDNPLRATQKTNPKLERFAVRQSRKSRLKVLDGWHGPDYLEVIEPSA